MRVLGVVSNAYRGVAEIHVMPGQAWKGTRNLKIRWLGMCLGFDRTLCMMCYVCLCRCNIKGAVLLARDLVMLVDAGMLLQ